MEFLWSYKFVKHCFLGVDTKYPSHPSTLFYLVQNCPTLWGNILFCCCWKDGPTSRLACGTNKRTEMPQNRSLCICCIENGKHICHHRFFDALRICGKSHWNHPFCPTKKRPSFYWLDKTRLPKNFS